MDDDDNFYVTHEYNGVLFFMNSIVFYLNFSFIHKNMTTLFGFQELK